MTVAPGTWPQPNADWTFENFLVGKENDFICGAALGLALSPGDVYNPFFLFGMPGAGKTHILHAIGNVETTGKGSDRQDRPLEEVRIKKIQVWERKKEKEKKIPRTKEAEKRLKKVRD